MFYAEARDLYTRVHAQARKMVNDFQKVSADPYLGDMDNEVDDSTIERKEDLGVIDIPVRQIVGAASSYPVMEYTFDFKPLSAPDSEYAEDWCKYYQTHLSVRGLSDPIECIEYLGRFYVVDGKKRVSVFKCHGDLTAKARVIRWIPKLKDFGYEKQYARFLQEYKKTGLYQIFLSDPNDYEIIRKAMDLAPDHVWNDMDRYHFMFTFVAIERAFYAIMGEYSSVTAADAFAALLKKYSFSEIRAMLPWKLTEALAVTLQIPYQLTSISAQP